MRENIVIYLPTVADCLWNKQIQKFKTISDLWFQNRLFRFPNNSRSVIYNNVTEKQQTVCQIGRKVKKMLTYYYVYIQKYVVSTSKFLQRFTKGDGLFKHFVIKHVTLVSYTNIESKQQSIKELYLSPTKVMRFNVRIFCRRNQSHFFITNGMILWSMKCLLMPTRKLL